MSNAETHLAHHLTPIERFTFLRTLHDHDVRTFYTLLRAHLTSLLPVIYTPTIAHAALHFSRLPHPRAALHLTPDDLPHLDDRLNAIRDDVRLLVVTDGEAVLGIGDQGVGGLAISVGKVTLHCAAAHLDPATALPVILDVGTYNAVLLADPTYIGWRHPRVDDETHSAVFAAFVQAVKRRWPHALIQWEDLAKDRAFSVLEAHRRQVLSFNDDIQGTAATVLAGVMTALRHSGARLEDQVFAVHGAGAAGVGVAGLLHTALVRVGLDAKQARRRVLVLDSRGLVHQGRTDLEAYKWPIAQEAVTHSTSTLSDICREFCVTALIGLSGQKGAFDEKIVRAMAENTTQPLIFPLSNPTSLSEAHPTDIARWTDGRAIVATGSPFPDVVHPDGQARQIGQGNNAFIFPGLALGALAARAYRITPNMLLAASDALANCITPAQSRAGLIYPEVSQLEVVAERVAQAVALQAYREHNARVLTPEAIKRELAHLRTLFTTANGDLPISR